MMDEYDGLYIIQELQYHFIKYDSSTSNFF